MVGDGRCFLGLKKQREVRVVRLFLSIVFYLLGAVCFVYSYIVAAVGSGSKFFLVWDALGVLAVLVGIGISFNVRSRIGPSVRIVADCIFGFGLILFVVLLCLVMSQYSPAEPKDKVDCLIVLGAQMRSDGPSVVLRYRLDRAAEYLTEHPDTRCIVSGARGSNEPCTEAEGMETYLISKGISANRIVREDMSFSTEENLSNSVILLHKGESVGIVTNNFHMKRALFLAEENSIEDPVPIVAPSTLLYAPNNVLREVLALLKTYIKALF